MILFKLLIARLAELNAQAPDGTRPDTASDYRMVRLRTTPVRGVCALETMSLQRQTASRLHSESCIYHYSLFGVTGAQ